MAQGSAARRFTASELGGVNGWIEEARPGRRLVTGSSRPVRASGHELRSPRGSLRALQDQVPLVKIKEIVARTEDVRGTVLTDKVIVQGVVAEQVFFVGRDGVVRERPFRIPFSGQVEVPGADPDLVEAGLQRVDVSADVEFIVTVPRPTGILNKIVVLVRVVVVAPGAGPGGTDLVVASATEQLLVEFLKQFEVVIPIVVPLPQVVREQVLVVEVKELPAVKIKRVDATVTGIRSQVLEGKVLVQGVVHKEVAFVDRANVVRLVSEDVPWSHVLVMPGVTPATPVVVTARVEFVLPELDAARGVLKQKIVLIVEGVAPTGRVITIISDVIGPGIVTTKVRFLLNGQVMEAVTDVTGPGLKSVTKETVLLDVLTDTVPQPQLVAVVVDVVFDP